MNFCGAYPGMCLVRQHLATAEVTLSCGCTYQICFNAHLYLSFTSTTCYRCGLDSLKIVYLRAW